MIIWLSKWRNNMCCILFYWKWDVQTTHSEKRTLQPFLVRGKVCNIIVKLFITNAADHYKMRVCHSEVKHFVWLHNAVLLHTKKPRACMLRFHNKTNGRRQRMFTGVPQEGRTEQRKCAWIYQKHQQVNWLHDGGTTLCWYQEDLLHLELQLLLEVSTSRHSSSIRKRLHATFKVTNLQRSMNERATRARAALDCWHLNISKHSWRSAAAPWGRTAQRNDQTRKTIRAVCSVVGRSAARPITGGRAVACVWDAWTFIHTGPGPSVSADDTPALLHMRNAGVGWDMNAASQTGWAAGGAGDQWARPIPSAANSTGWQTASREAHRWFNKPAVCFHERQL